MLNKDYLQRLGYLDPSNASYIDELYERYLADPESVDPTWRYFFDGVGLGERPIANGHAAADSSLEPSAIRTKRDLGDESKVAELITLYRSRGWLLTHLDPLGTAPESHPMLELKNFGLNEAHLDRTFAAGDLLGMPPSSLRDIIARLREIYCRTLGVQYAHIQDAEVRDWIQQKLEPAQSREALSAETRKNILNHLTHAEGFERFLHTRFVAQKRFSLEGGEALIPALDRMIRIGAELGIEQIVVGMAHRGRLNVLTNIFDKKPEYIFTEFAGEYQTDETMGEGDVKYHGGYSADVTTTRGKTVHLSLAYNPSHLEFVDAVACGAARGKQRYMGDTERARVAPILIHGDAAFAGQGVVYETLNLSQVEGYTVGGTIHVVINNQVGFTTDAKDARSTTHCTDLALMLEVPIFHVNGDDVEAVYFVSRLAVEYRQRFKKDVFINLVCYRKYGHNEGDEPAFTQPVIYAKIKTHPSPREIYAAKLAREGVASEAECQALVDAHTSEMQAALDRTRAEKPRPFASAYQSIWKKFRRATEADLFEPVNTAVDESKLRALSAKLNTMPAGFNAHPKLERMLKQRQEAVDAGEGLDWGNAETLAYASLLTEGHIVRLSGQDVQRGTFNHRHSVLHDPVSGAEHTPLNHLETSQSLFLAYNSTLSETGVLGFEYGWSLADPDALVIWEAQFGDFANGAQVIIDQFISSGESKWQRASGIVLLLPHGYEGQGPEHSSCRVERFLQLCGKQNMTVCNLSSPAQVFHALRRQLKRSFRKPLVIATPKSLLRHPKAVSSLADLSKGSFQEVIDDASFDGKDRSQVSKVLLCTGKVYYDLLAEREARGLDSVAIVRLEQIYPWPATVLAKVLGSYGKAKDIVWVQEEPLNMGAWSFIFNTWAGGYDDFQTQVGGRPIRYVGRGRAAAPAVGSAKVHAKEQKEIIEAALKP
ncbi:MAG: 2-oxoglutarate dehydrogenase E1 component [Bdellovibrionales bacterium]|nr:2-oxoglutarate dehydrogenase E1 component [Bdellovibrionales bacterium]